VERAVLLELRPLGIESVNLMEELSASITTIGDGGTSANGLTVASPEVVVEDADNPVEIVEQYFSCSNDGTMARRYERSQAPYSNITYSFNNCVIYQKTYNGSVTSRSGRRSPDIETFSDFEVTFKGMTQTITGTTERSHISIGNGERVKWNIDSYSRSGKGPVLSIRDMSWELYGILRFHLQKPNKTKLLSVSTWILKKIILIGQRAAR